MLTMALKKVPPHKTRVLLNPERVKSDNQKTEALEEMTQKQNVDDNAPKAQEVRSSSRVQSKSMDSGPWVFEILIYA